MHSPLELRRPSALRVEAVAFDRARLALVRVDHVAVDDGLRGEARRVDVRVLPLIFRFERPKELNVFPGQLVDVYIGASRQAAVAR